MLDFSELASARQQVNQRDREREEDFQACLNDAIAELTAFQQAPNRQKIERLRAAADYLIESLEFHQARPEAYFLLASIFYILQENRLATRYLHYVRTINPEYPGLEGLQTLLQTKTESIRPKRKGTGNLDGTGKLKPLRNLRRTGSLAQKLSQAAKPTPSLSFLNPFKRK